MNHNRISNKKINDIIKILSNNNNNSKFIENNEYTQNKCIKDYKNNHDKIKQKKNIFSLNIILKNIQNNIRNNTKIDNNIKKNKLSNDLNFNTKNIHNNISYNKCDEKNSIQKEDFIKKKNISNIPSNNNDIITRDIVKTITNYKNQTNIIKDKLDDNTNIINKDILKTDSNNKTHTNIDKDILKTDSNNKTHTNIDKDILKTDSNNKTHTNIDKDILKTDSNNKTHTNITKDKLNVNNNDNKNLKINKAFTYKNYYKENSYIFVDNKLICNIFENHQNIQIKSNEPIVFAICILIYKKFLYLNNSKRDLFIKELKYIMAVDLDKKNLYEKFKYNHKRFKKTEFQNDLIENKIMNNEYFYMYIGDYFNINIIFKDNNLIKYFNNYSSNRYSLLIINFDNDIYVHYNCDDTSLLSDELCIKNNINLKINITKKTTKYNYNNLKISELQNMAKSKNIDIKKQGKTSLINKTKKELIDDLGLNSIESEL